MPAALIHRTPFAGTWYPADPATLSSLLDRLFRDSEVRASGPLLDGAVGFVVPHAGLAYSGRVAAAAYRHLAQQRPRTVVLLGFAHRGAPRGVWIPEVDAYDTPLGEVAVDRDAVASLLSTGPFALQQESVLCDHSVEIQLPLLQHACPDISIVPVYVSSLTEEQRAAAARALAATARNGAVLLASSDFTHYGAQFHYQPFPLDRNTALRLRTLDERFIDAAGSIDAGIFSQSLRAKSATVCGREPIMLLLAALRQLPDGDDFFQLTLDYETSGDITGDYGHSVSYAALGHFPWSAFQLDDEEKLLLFHAARQTLRHYQETGKATPVAPERTPFRLERRAGAFVTLRVGGRLRGCIGRVASSQPLAAAVPELTLSAALDDRRFESLRPDEPSVAIDISVLSPLKLLADHNRLRVGIDGAYLTMGGLSGLLLPQVAHSGDWTTTGFLEALARKASLTAGALDDPSTKLHTFRAQVIN